jgi:hypothetical protein
MPKKPLQDVVPPKKSIRQIILPRDHADNEQPAETVRSQASAESKMSPDSDSIIINRDRVPRNETSLSSQGGPIGADNINGIGPRSKVQAQKNVAIQETRTTSKRLWIVAVLLIVLIYIATTFVFSGASVVVTERTETTTLDALFTVSVSGSPTDLTYQTMSLTKEGQRSLAAVGEEFVEKKAEGTITVYNNYSESPQRLVTNTRFETEDGLIYRIPAPIVVPGVQDIDGKKVPGSVETAVLAEYAGVEYNIGPTRFTIPGLKGDPRFDDMYAESIDSMKGGFSGDVLTVEGQAEAEARSQIEGDLRAALLEEAQNKIPEGFILYENAIAFSNESLPNTAGENAQTVNVRESVILQAVIFDKKELSKYIARSTIADFDGQDVLVRNLSELAFSLAGDEDEFRRQIEKKETAQFMLEGAPEIVWTFDEARLRQDLAGKSKKMVDTVLSAYPGIDSAKISIKPIWDSTFPKNPDNIKIIVR